MNDQLEEINSVIDALMVEIECINAHTQTMQEAIFQISDFVFNEEQSKNFQCGYWSTLNDQTTAQLHELAPILHHKAKALGKAFEISTTIRNQIKALGFDPDSMSEE